MKWHCCGFGLLTALGLACVASGQEPTAANERESATGIVRGHDGKPWVGATVELVGRPWSKDPTIGWEDVVRVTTACGRFRAEILPGVDYAAWAHLAVDHGGYVSTPIAERLAPRQPILLDGVVAPPSTLAQLALSGAAAFGDDVRVELRSSTEPVLRFVLARDADGAFVVPPLPRAALALRVRTRSGAPIASESWEPSQFLNRSRRLDLPEPKPCRFSVRDIDSGKGVPGASILQDVDGELVELGVTGDDGCAEFPAPSPSSGTARPQGRLRARRNAAARGCRR